MLAGTLPPVKNWRMFLEQRFTALHALGDGKIREKMLKFSSAVLPAPSPYLQQCLEALATRNVGQCPT